jgi:hypothetical protein
MLAGPPNLFAAVDLSNYLQQPVSWCMITSSGNITNYSLK